MVAKITAIALRAAIATASPQAVKVGIARAVLAAPHATLAAKGLARLFLGGLV